MGTSGVSAHTLQTAQSEAKPMTFSSYLFAPQVKEADANILHLATREEEMGEILFFPDPPYVVNQTHTTTSDPQNEKSLQAYWKNHVQWVSGLPKVEEARLQSQSWAQELQEMLSRAEHPSVYVNVSGGSVGIRSAASVDEAYKTGEVIPHGQCVAVKTTKDVSGTNFLELSNGKGFVFEDLGETKVMAEVKLYEVGKWWYKVVCSEILETRTGPTHDDRFRAGCFMCEKETMVVNFRCRILGESWLRLADGRGWIFETKPGAPHRARQLKNHTVEEIDAEMMHAGTGLSVAHLIPVTDSVVEVGTWSYLVGDMPVLAIGTKPFGVFLTPGETVQVDKKCWGRGAAPTAESSSRHWLRLADGRGWVPLTALATGQALLLPLLSAESTAGFHITGPELNLPPKEWMIGMA